MLQAAQDQNARTFDAASAGFPLSLAVSGERVRIVALGGSDASRKRLFAMGLGIGSEFELAQREGPSGVVLKLEASRIALGASLLHRIRVIKL